MFIGTPLEGDVARESMRGSARLSRNRVELAFCRAFSARSHNLKFLGLRFAPPKTLFLRAFGPSGVGAIRLNKPEIEGSSSLCFPREPCKAGTLRLLRQKFDVKLTRPLSQRLQCRATAAAGQLRSRNHKRRSDSRLAVAPRRSVGFQANKPLRPSPGNRRLRRIPW